MCAIGIGIQFSYVLNFEFKFELRQKFKFEFNLEFKFEFQYEFQFLLSVENVVYLIFDLKTRATELLFVNNWSLFALWFLRETVLRTALFEVRV